MSRNEGRGEAGRRQWASSHKPCLMPNPTPHQEPQAVSFPLDSILLLKIQEEVSIVPAELTLRLLLPLDANI